MRRKVIDQSISTGVLPLAARMRGIEPFHVMEVLARAKALEAEGRDIVHMEIGEPDFPTPRPICEAGIRALESGNLFYTPSLGLPELREALSGYYATCYGIDVSAERIIITSGSSAALFLTLAVLVDPGSQVILADPGYPANRHFVRVLDGEPLNVAVDAESGYQLTPDVIERSWTGRTIAAIVATPSSPSGAVVGSGDLERIAVYCSERGGKLIVDEIYHGLVYEGQAQSALAVSDEVFVINSFSK